MLEIIVIVLCASFFAQAARIDKAPVALWVGLSILISLLTMFFVPFGILGMFAGQIGLFVGITTFRMIRK